MKNTEEFHQDKHLLDLVDLIIQKGGVKNFIETGSFEGDTISFIERTYPNINCMSCEPNTERYDIASNKIVNENTKIFNITSQDFMKNIKNTMTSLYDTPVLFWLDAHGYGFEWPLREEMAFISQNFNKCYILIDDFRVPENPAFGFDTYNGQKCSHEYIKNDIAWTTTDHNIFYPNYTEHTSPIHPLRGWGLYTHGVPIDFLNNNICKKNDK